MELISFGSGILLKIFSNQYNSLYLQLFESDEITSTMKFSPQYLFFLKNNLNPSKGSQTHCSLGLSGVMSFSDDSGAALTQV